MLERVRAHSAVLGALAVGGLAILSVAGLAVSETRLDAAFPKASTASTTAPPAPTSAADAAIATNLLATINADRASGGSVVLIADSDIGRVAAEWAAQMATDASLGHQDLDRVLDLGYDTAAETILVGPPGADATAIETAWLNSEANRTTILGREFTRAGVGVATGPDGRVWVAVDLAD